jgi:eukaryotic-like serine/threonine-protein kinase
LGIVDAVRACPECRVVFEEGVQLCPEHDVELIAVELYAKDDSLEPGSMVGEYRIERKLGAGSFGDVYAGEHPLIGKKVAIKVLKSRVASEPQTVSRFISEARAVNKIRHRNIIDIFSFHVLPGPRHCLVMELLDGLTLAELLEQKGRLPFRDALPILQGIAAALDAVHEAGITHRDLKPENVFLAKERDGNYFPKLLDFGIAKLAEDESSQKTRSGVVLGTPRYMAPEQARGRRVDNRADIYALGIMTHEMLSGAPPFTGDSAMDILCKHDSEPPPRLSMVCPDVTPEVEAAVLAMLEKRPRNRPASAGEAIAAMTMRAADGGLAPRPSMESIETRTVQANEPVGTESADEKLARLAQSTDGGSSVDTAPRRTKSAKRALLALSALAAAALLFVFWPRERGATNKPSLASSSMEVPVAVTSVATNSAPLEMASAIPAEIAVPPETSASAVSASAPPPVVTNSKRPPVRSNKSEKKASRLDRILGDRE